MAGGGSEDVAAKDSNMDTVYCALAEVVVSCEHGRKLGIIPSSKTSYLAVVNEPQQEDSWTEAVGKVSKAEQAKLFDKITIQATMSDGPCGSNHPLIKITDQLKSSIASEERGKTSSSFAAAFQEMSGSKKKSMFSHFKLDDKPTPYTVAVVSCGKTSGTNPTSGSISTEVRVYPKTDFEMSITIPPLSSRKYENSAKIIFRDGENVKAKVTKYSKTSNFGSDEKTTKTTVGELDGRTLTKRTSKESTDFGQEKYTQTERLEATPGSLDYSFKEVYEWKDPDSGGNFRPVLALLDSPELDFSFTKNRQDVSETSEIADLVRAIVHLGETLHDALNFIKHFQPQAGWSFEVDVSLFQGSLAYKWGWREFTDHRVYKYHDATFKILIFKVSFRINCGIALPVLLRVTIYGSVEIDFPVEGTLTLSNPDEKSANSVKFKPKPTVKLGAEIEFGDKWIYITGWVSAGLDGVATPKLDQEKGFRIEYQVTPQNVEVHYQEGNKLRANSTRERTAVIWKFEGDPWLKGEFPSTVKKAKV
jgi:hypothetical protein